MWYIQCWSYFSRSVRNRILILIIFRLFGEGLFPGKGHTDILKQNKKCEINFNHKKYDIIDRDAKDLLFKMIDKDPISRITAEESLKHDYFLNEFNAFSIPPLIR